MRSPVNHIPALAAVLLIAASAAAAAPAVQQQRATSGPAADYPVTVGEPFTIGFTTWTPADQLNYDAVGQADIEPGLSGVSAAHKTLPLPSYVEVTSLASGQTILVRLVERGPMVNDTLLALSPDAAAQLGMGEHTPVRVRRVNPPEVERAALRAGGQVPQRMDTPESLLKVLRRKLAEQSPLLPPPSTPPAMPSGPPPRHAANLDSSPTPAPTSPKPVAKRDPAPVPKPPPAASAAPRTGGMVVQVAAFSTAERAKAAAAKLGGRVSPTGRLWRVRLGPFGDRTEAAAALGKAKAAGYSDARIQRAD